MKALVIAEYREGRLLDTSYELVGFARTLGAETAMFLVGDSNRLPLFDGKLYLAEASSAGEYQPDLHKKLILEVVLRENPDLVIFLHSSYGWDLAPRVAVRLGVGQVSEVIAIGERGFELGCLNQKMRRTVKVAPGKLVVTVQIGAFPPLVAQGTPAVEILTETAQSPVEFLGYQPPAPKALDLSHAEIIVSAGRGIGKKENVEVVAALARALGGELGASRPVVDAGWLEHSHQVGTTGQTVSPKLYVACGISGSIQHVAGMKKSGFVVAINKDKDAPIGEIADVLVVADVMQVVPALTAKLKARG